MRGKLIVGLLLIAVGAGGLIASSGVGIAGTWRGLAAQGGPWGWMPGWGHMGGHMGNHMSGWGQSVPSGAASTPVAGAPTVEISALDFSLRPAQMQVKTGQPVSIALSNRGVILHDITIPGLQFQLVAQPGQRTLGSLTAARPGTYEVFCSVPGHREAGMVGRLVVTP